MSLSILCYVVAVVLFVLASIPGFPTGKINLVALGLAFFALGHVVPA